MSKLLWMPAVTVPPTVAKAATLGAVGTTSGMALKKAVGVNVSKKREKD